MTRLLNLFFRLLYHQLAWSYDLVAWIVSLGQWNNWTHALLDYLDDSAAPILELGFGPGHLQKKITQTGYLVIGLDRSNQMAHIAAKKMKKADLPQNLVQGDGRSLPFSDGSISQVLAAFPTEYIFEHQTLQEIARILPTDGKFVLLPFVTISGKKPAYRFLSWVYRITGQTPSIHPEKYAAINQLFRSAGFDLAHHKIARSFYTLEIIEARLLP